VALIGRFTCKVYSRLAVALTMTLMFGVRQISILLAHDFYHDTHSDDLEVSSDPSSPFAYASPLETSTSLDTSEDVPIISDPSIALASLAEIEEGDGCETNASSNS